jgi:hypothetical protein
VEPRVQHAASTVPSLTALLGVAYLSMHLGVTGATLIWLFRRAPATFVGVRTALVLSTALSVVVFVVYPVAPPRLARISVRDTVSGGLISLNHGLLHSLYNPFAAVPSLHFGYALIVGIAVVRHARRLISRAVGAGYPVFVLFTIVATGNHLFVDAAAGGAVVAVGAAAAFALGPGSVRSMRRSCSIARTGVAPTSKRTCSPAGGAAPRRASGSASTSAAESDRSKGTLSHHDRCRRPRRPSLQCRVGELPAQTSARVEMTS